MNVFTSVAAITLITQKQFLILLIFLIPVFAISQHNSEEEAVIAKMCAEFKNTPDLGDKERVENLFVKFLYAYLEKFPDEEINAVGDAVYFRFQKECPEFRKFLLDTSNTENWKAVSEMPEIEFTSAQKKEFDRHANYYYFEGAGNEITNVKIADRIWMEEFPDNSYSKNKFYWENDAMFALEHIESNNEARKAFSRKGEKYYYTVINKRQNYYTIAAQIPGQDEILIFKLFKNR